MALSAFLAKFSAIMVRGIAHLGKLLFALTLGGLLATASAHGQSFPIRDGGINPANLGKGDWIYFMSAATNKLGGAAPSVVNIPTLMSFYKSQGLQYIIVKAGTGSTNFNGSGNSPQFNSNLVYHAHAAGLLIFAYTRSYDDDVQGEINMASNYFALGADGWVIDAEAEWESSQAPNGPTRAIQYGEGLRALFPNKFIAHAPFPIIRFHSSFPYKEFGSFCDVVMPQAYWKSIYGNDSNAVATMFSEMDNEFRKFQTNLTGIWTNAIKPIVPIAQAYNPAANEITTAAEVDEFFDRCRTNPNPASITGYKGMNFWRADTKPADMWTAIRTNQLGDFPGPPNLTMQPTNRTVPLSFSNLTFTAWGTGSKPFYYRWRFNGTNLPGAAAASPNYIITNAQPFHAGAYSVVVSNVSGVTTSMVATLEVIQPPSLFNISAAAGGTAAIISWNSTNPSTTQVEYGLTTNLGLATYEDPAPVTNHVMMLAGLLPRTNYFFTVVSRAGTNVHRSGGWSFSTAPDVILDNGAATYSGSWITASSSTDKYGSDYRYASTVTNTTTASALYYPNVPTKAGYDISLWYPQGGNRTTNALINIIYSGGTLAARVNQRTNGGRWVPVGTNLTFRPGQFDGVRISNFTGETSGVVMADALRLSYNLAQDKPAGPATPDWWTQFYFGSSVSPLLDSDGDGNPNWAEYLVGTAPNSPASRLSFRLDAVNATMLQATFYPHLPDRLYQLERCTNFGSGWQILSNTPPAALGNGSAVFYLPNGPEPLNFYRLKISWMP
jgi:hypothetical protein